MNDDNNDVKNNKNKDEWNKKYTLIAIYSFIVILASFAAILIILGVRDFFVTQQYLKFFKVLTPIIYGFVFAYLLNPLLIFFQNKVFLKLGKKIKNLFSILATYLTTGIVITLILLMVIPQVILSVQQLTGRAIDWLSPYDNSQNINFENTDNNEKNAEIDTDTDTNTDIDIETTPKTNIENIENEIGNNIANSKLAVYLNDLGISIQDYIDSLGLKINVEETFAHMADNLVNLLSTYVISAINGTLVFLYGIFSSVLNFILGILLSIYLLISKDKLIAQVKKLFFALFPGKFSYKMVGIMRKTHEIFGGFITGKILDSVIVGIICFIGMSILGMHYTALITVIVAVTNVIPFFGPFIGAIPSLFFLAINDIWEALWFLIFILVLQQIDGNIIGPKILSSKVGLSAFWVIVSIIVMGGLFGIPGIFFGTPVFAVAYVLIKEFAENKLINKGFPTETEKYIRDPNSITPEFTDYTKNSANKNKMSKESKSAFFGNALHKTAKNIMGILNPGNTSKNADSSEDSNPEISEKKKTNNKNKKNTDNK